MRLAPRKRVVPLLRVFAMANASLLGSAQVRLTIVGDGPERSIAERFCERHGLGSLVTFTGRLGHDEILDLYAHSDLFVQPSVKESFGLAALEARCAGLPVLARSQTGTAQFIHHGVEGFLAERDRDMARIIMEVARDRSSLDAIAAHNRETEPEQAWPMVLDDVRQAYALAASRVPTWPH